MKSHYSLVNGGQGKGGVGVSSPQLLKMIKIERDLRG